MKAVTKNKYQAIRTLLNSDTPWDELQKYMNVDAKTVTLIVQSNGSYEDYEALVKSFWAGNINAKKEEKKVTSVEPQKVHHEVIMTANHYFMQELKDQTDLLRHISAKLAFIVDELCGTNKKESGT